MTHIKHNSHDIYLSNNVHDAYLQKNIYIISLWKKRKDLQYHLNIEIFYSNSGRELLN